MIYDWDIEKIGNQDRTYVMKIVVTFIQFVIASFLPPPHQWLPPRDQAIYTTELIVGKQCNSDTELVDNTLPFAGKSRWYNSLVPWITKASGLHVPMMTLIYKNY